MKRNILSAAAIVLSLLAGSYAQAHFLWIVTDPASGQAKVYFGEAAEPDDPDLLDKLTSLKLVSFPGRGEAKEVGVEKLDDALVSKVGKPAAVGLSHRYGVLERGGEKFLLVYHGTTHSSSIPADWKRVGGDRVPLEIVPSRQDGKISLQLLWKGKPVPDAQIVASGVGLAEGEGKTDAEGKFVVEPTKSGRLQVRARLIEDGAGKADGQAYDSTRHWTTLTLPVTLPASTVQTLDHQLPDVPKGVTSFGGAVIGDDVYIYGGHLGGAHHYWKEGQSNELLRLNVKEGQKWEQLAAGPRRTGTALVAHGGKLYRIGGFEARNAEGDEGDLHSMADVQRFDPASGKWEEFASMPTPRSSHDAAVLGDTLYVVGGWNLQEGNDGEFHDNMLTLDLKAEQPQWKSSTVSFKRRALSVAAHNGKLYAIGGMQSEGGPATDVDVFDPKTNTWSTGPALHGQGMEGFGSTAFEIGGRLTVVTISGAIQQLSADGKSWELNGNLKHPRFFARLLPISGDRGIVIAGADMGSGKVTATELIRQPKAAAEQ